MEISLTDLERLIIYQEAKIKDLEFMAFRKNPNYQGDDINIEKANKQRRTLQRLYDSTCEEMINKIITTFE